MGADVAHVVLTEQIMLTAPGQVGLNALIGALVPRVLRASVVVLGHDGDPIAAACASQFARHAVHGGFATDNGRTWIRPQIHLRGRATTAQLIEAAQPDGLAASFTAAETGASLRLYTAAGAAVTEDSGLGQLRERLATGQPALPVNTLCVGTIIEHCQDGTPK